MKINNVLLLSITCALFHSFVFGQDSRVPKVIPPSPNASAFQKYGDIQVSAYTGSPNISIPLYEIKSGDISIPLSISYMASGIRVADEASRTGLGWVLNAGGAISRTVIGGDDFEFPTYSYNNQTIQEIPKAPRFDQGGNFNIKEGCDVTLNGYGINHTIPSTVFSDGSNYDLQPDQYSYNFNGHSGKFVLRRNREVVLNKNEKIEIKVLGADASSWEIKTPDGVLYKFEQFESYVDFGGTANQHKSSWYLTKIVSATGRTVEFEYTSNSSYIQSIGSYFESKPGANLATTTSGATAPNAFSYFSAPVNGKWYTNLYLSKIKFDNGEVLINYLSDRLDLANDVKINNIQIYSKKVGAVNQLVKTWNFNFSYFEGTNYGNGYNPNVSAENMAKRLKLTSVQETNGSLTLPPYEFYYNNENDYPSSLPGKLSFSRDHWGFYNGKNNTSLVPSFTNSCNNNPIEFYLGLMGNERSPDPQFNQLFILKKIKYPTGGSSIFEYETHDFDYINSKINDHSYFANYVATVPAIAQNTFSNIGLGGTFSTTLDLTNMIPCGQDINVVASFINYSGLDVASANQITYTLQKSNGQIIGAGYVGEFLGNAAPPMTEYLGSQTTNSGVKLTLSKGLSPDIYTWSFFVPSGINLYAASISIAYSKPETIDPIFNGGETVYNAQFGGGLRIKKITDYTDVSTVARVKKYNYHYLLHGKSYSYGRCMSKPNYSYFAEMAGVASNPNDICSGCPPPILAISNVLIRESDSNIPLNGSAGGSTVGYDKVEELFGGNGENGKSVYEYHNQPDLIYNYSQSKQVLNQITTIPRKPPFGGAISNPGNGNLLKQVDFLFNGNNYIPVRELVNNYEDLIPNYDNAAVIGIEKRTNRGTHPFVDSDCYLTNYIYPSITENRYVLFSSTNKTFDPSGTTPSLTTTTEYSYDNSTHLQLNSKTDYTSKGDKLVTSFKYPADYPDLQCDPALLLMKGAAYMHAIPVLKQTTITKGDNQYLADAAISKFQVINNKVFAKEIATLENANLIDVNSAPTAYNPSTNLYPNGFLPRLIYDNYDVAGNISQLHKKDDVPITYIWDYSNSYPIAEITNASINACAYTSFESDGKGNWSYSGTTAFDAFPLTGEKTYALTGGNISATGLDATKTYIVSYWSKTTSAIVNGSTGLAVLSRNGWTYFEHVIAANTSNVTVSGSVTIDELRLFPQGSLITTYTYAPLIGMTSQTDPNGRTTYYEHDPFGRLLHLRDHNNNIIKKYCYNYAGQTINCYNPVYKNSIAYSGQFQRTNCGSGYTGSTVTYNVPIYDVTSEISEADANAKAQLKVQQDGPAYANANGVCTPTAQPGYCSLTVFSPIYFPTYSLYCNGSATSGYLVVWFPSGITMGSTVTIGAFSAGSCKPSVNRYQTVESGGRTYAVTYSASGTISVQLVGGGNLPAQSSISISSINFNL